MYTFNRSIKSSAPQKESFIAVSTFEECGFEFNEFGTIRSDFAQLVNSQSILAMEQASQRLAQLRSVEPDNRDKSFDDIVREIRPRWMQSPKQIMEFEDYLLEHDISGLEDIQNQIRLQRAEAAENKRIDDANKAVATSVNSES